MRFSRQVKPNFTEDFLETAFHKLHEGGFQDHKIRQTVSIQHGSVGKWKSWDLKAVDAMWQIVGETALKLGYTGPPVDTAAH